MNVQTSPAIEAITSNANSRLSSQVKCLDSRLSICATERTRTAITVMLIGGVIGFVIGVAQLIAIGSWNLFYWAFMPLIPLCSALGWSLLKMIIGGSGLFSSATVEAQNESQNYPIDIAA